MFTYNINGIALEAVNTFKYLGVMFSNACSKLRYTTAIEHRLMQSKRLVAAWMRRCAIWMFKPDVVVHQFKTCVMPALEYGVGLWGAGQYRSTIWEKVESFWRFIARCILGVHQRSPNSGVYGELGWFPFQVRACKQASSMFTRITKLGNECLVRKAMYVQRSMYAAIITY